MLEIWKYGKYSKTAGMFIYFLELKLQHITTYGYKLKNAYLDDHGKERDYGDNCIFIQLEPIMDNGDNEGVLQIFKRKADMYIDSYTYDNDLIVVIRVPDELLTKFNYFKEGKYSKLGRAEAVKYFSVPDIRYHVIVRTIDLKKVLETTLEVTLDNDAELADPPEPSKEILRFDEVKFRAMELNLNESN